MAIIISKSNYLRILSLCLFSVSCFCSANNKPNKNGGGFKGMFVFGSSVVDNGNNNNVKESTSKANYLPYGIDFVDGPTGRFSNGKNVADCIGDHLNLPLIPAFAVQNTLRNSYVFLHGVNYGSGGSGILNNTGAILGKVISLHEQVTNFEGATLPKLENRLRRPRKKILRNYLFLIAAGNNDYSNYLFFPGNHSPSNQSDAEAYAEYLIAAYSVQLKRLHKLGARNYLLLAPYPLGCAPGISQGRGCLPEPNAFISVFYDQLISKMKQMKQEMPGSEFVVLNSVKVISDILNNGNTTGLSNVKDPCCELSSNGSSCKVNGTTCADRKSYAFFDVVHYTESASAAIAAKVYASRDASEVFPANLYRLAKRPRSNAH